MARKRTATQPKPAEPRPVEFATFSQLIDADKDLKAAKTKEDVSAVFKHHFMKIGWKRLSKLLIGAKPEDLVMERGEQ